MTTWELCSTVTAEFILPYIGSTSGDSLLTALFDLIRHGLVHQYQQIVVHLNDEKHFYISLTGATYGRYLVKKDGTVEEECLNQILLQNL
jgi:hypothetical protein